MSVLSILSASPMTTVQDLGRPGFLAHGISASGPMDRQGFEQAGALTGAHCGAAIEIGPQGLAMRYRGAPLLAGFAGGAFRIEIDGTPARWPLRVELTDGMTIVVTTGPWGNYAYMRASAEIDVPVIMGSRATNATVGLGGFRGRALEAGDTIGLIPLAQDERSTLPSPEEGIGEEDAPIRMIWGIHADLFDTTLREAFCRQAFRVSSRMDRMGVRLDDTGGIFSTARILGLVSDAVVPGDIQILGDGTPIVLMRDHQPTGGYPRIGTICTADLDRFAQTRPGRMVRFSPITLDRAHALGRGR